MSHALTALVLIHVDSHRGEWCSITRLSEELLTPMHVLRPICDALVDAGQIARSMSGMFPSYGVYVASEAQA